MKNDIVHQVSPILSNIVVEKTFSQISLTLLQIIVLIILLSWLFKKIFLIKPYEMNSYIKIISRMSIGSNESIVIIEIQDLRLLLGITKNRITCLHTLTAFKKEKPEKKN